MKDEPLIFLYFLFFSTLTSLDWCPNQRDLLYGGAIDSMSLLNLFFDVMSEEAVKEILI